VLRNEYRHSLADVGIGKGVTRIEPQEEEQVTGCLLCKEEEEEEEEDLVCL
jgi:hypothetical protein